KYRSCLQLAMELRRYRKSTGGTPFCKSPSGNKNLKKRFSKLCGEFQERCSFDLPPLSSSVLSKMWELVCVQTRDKTMNLSKSAIGRNTVSVSYFGSVCLL